ncbi:MAG: hypothetical protein KTR35_18185 [Gammaproteobacteria bacterium]|nr:hypothetical protein [Gammaproteobacteria bacterium]
MNRVIEQAWGLVCLLGRQILAIVVLALPHPALAQESASEDDESSIFTNVGSFVDSAQQSATDRFNNWVLQVDDFFGGDQSVSGINQSWARLRIDAVQPGAEDTKIRGTVKLRLVLPRSEQRFRLLLSTEDEDASSSDPSRAGTANANARDDQDVSFALRFIRSARTSGSLNFDVGARIRDDKGQAFGRINSSWKSTTESGWHSNLTNNLFYYSSSGYENRLRFDLRKPWFGSEKVFFRTSTNFNWRKGRKGAAISETLGLYGQINPRTALAGEAIFEYSTALNEDATDRYHGSELRLRLRQNVWRPYFYYEIWPSVSWPSINGYKKAYGGLIRVEFVIGDTG